MDNKTFYYCSADGDNIGNIIGKSFLSNDIEQLKSTAKKIEIGGHIMRVFVMKHRGEIINIGGDEGVWAVPESALNDLESLRENYHQATGFTLSVGVGRLPSESAKSLLVAKIRGKDQIAYYGKSIKKEIKIAKEKVRKHKASIAEQKLAEAGLLKTETPTHEEECEYCRQTDGIDTDHCKYCHDEDDNCKYCLEAEQAQPENTEDDCPYCQDTEMECPYCQEEESTEVSDDGVEPDSGPQVQLPTTTSSQDYSGQDLTSPDIGKPDAISANPDGTAFNPDTPTNENIKLDQAQNDPNASTNTSASTPPPEGNDSIQSVLDDVDALPPTETQARQERSTTDQADMANGTNMEGNISRPDGFDANTPSDMGLGDSNEADSQSNVPEYEKHPENTAQAEAPVEENPDISAVLHEGLDSHADSIKKEKTIQMVSEALQKFKACKSILEKAQTQAPQLYDASISMLRAMIEMAKVMGLDQDQPEQPADGTVNDSPEYEQHPENAAALGDAAPSTPKTQGQLVNQ